MEKDWKKDQDMIIVGTLLLALWALSATFLALEFGFFVILEATAVYFMLMALIAASSYVVMVNILRRVSILSNWRVIVPFSIIFFGSIFEVWLVAKFIKPMISSESGIVMANRIEPGFTLYAILGVMMLIFSVICAFETLKREIIEKIRPSIDVSLDQNMDLNTNFKEVEKT